MPTETLFERMSDAQTAHARRDDPKTSHEAAAVVTPHMTEIHRLVQSFALERPDGFLDVALVEQFPHLGPSTLRTRRSELTARNVILDSMRRETPAGHSTPHTIWIHRSFVDAPPPLVDPPAPITGDDRSAARRIAGELVEAARVAQTYGLVGCSKVATEAAAMLRRLSA